MVCARQPPLEPHKPVRVLIVEDEQITRRALGSVLRSRGFRVELAGSAEQALKILNRADPPDAILVDVDLPGMNGLELLRRLSMFAPHVLPLIVSSVDRERVRAVTDQGVTFVRKPVDLSRLLTLLDNVKARG